MIARNEITGDQIATKSTSDAYRDNYDRIFGKKRPQLLEDIGPDKTPEQLLYEEDVALEELRSGMWFEDAER
jgi:hypothetical protein